MFELRRLRDRLDREARAFGVRLGTMGDKIPVNTDATREAEHGRDAVDKILRMINSDSVFSSPSSRKRIGFTPELLAVGKAAMCKELDALIGQVRGEFDEL